MRSSHVATLAAITVGLTAASALHRRAGRSAPAAPARTAPTRTAPTHTAPAGTAPSAITVASIPVRDGVVLPFLRPVPPASAPQAPAGPARCGDSGGRTKAGAPCAARATQDGRCHHHRLAA